MLLSDQIQDDLGTMVRLKKTAIIEVFLQTAEITGVFNRVRKQVTALLDDLDVFLFSSGSGRRMAYNL